MSRNEMSADCWGTAVMLDTPIGGTALSLAADAMKILDERPSVLDDILVIMANGGSLIQCAQKLGVPYSRLSVWCNATEERRTRMSEAMKARDEFLIQRILDELKLIGLHDVSQLFDEEGHLRPMKDLPEGIRRSIASVEIVETADKDGKISTIKKVRMIDKLKGIEMLTRAMVGFIEKKQINVEHTYKVQSFDLDSRMNMLKNVIDVPAQEKANAADVRPADAAVPQDI